MNYLLVVNFASSVTQTLGLERSCYTIGRFKRCDVVVPKKFDFVSRIHLTFIRGEKHGKNYCLLMDGAFYPRKISSNGAWVNGVKIDDSIELNHQDEITFSSVEKMPKIVFLVEEKLQEIEDTWTHEKEAC